MKLEFLIGRYDLFSGSFKKGLENINISIRLAKKLNDAKYLMENYLQMVFHSIQIHNLKMFNEYITACEELIGQYPYSDASIFTVMRLRGVYYMKNFQYSKAEKVFQELIEKLEPLCWMDSAYQISLAACYNYLGEGSQAVGDIETALKYYLQAIERCESDHIFFNGLGVFYSNAGYAFYCQGNLERAKDYIEKANCCFEEKGALWGRARAKAYAALLAIAQGKCQEGEELYQAARDIAQKEGSPSALSFLHNIEQLLSRRMSGKSCAPPLIRQFIQA
ncbi:MAG: tetratricopeptide repeat protein, partial [Sporomusa sp.]